VHEKRPLSIRHGAIMPLLLGLVGIIAAILF